MQLIRPAKLEDAPRLLEIYDYYVQETAITFETETPSLEEFQRRMHQTMKRYPYLVIEQDGVVQGYAYAGAFINRAAYDWACELTIYLDMTTRHQGMGKTLYRALEKELQAMGLVNLYACVAYPDKEDAYLTNNSMNFHTHLGYAKCGEFKQCGYKFNHWYNMAWMEKIIGDHDENPRPIVAYPQIRR